MSTALAVRRGNGQQAADIFTGGHLEMKTASAGTENKSDIQITVVEWDGGELEVSVRSTVERQFGAAIYQTICGTARRMGVNGVRIMAVDNGAPDFVIESRVEAALKRLRRG